MVTRKQETAIRAVVFNELGLLRGRRVETIGFSDLEQDNVPANFIDLIRTLTKKENEKPPIDRNFNFVMEQIFAGIAALKTEFREQKKAPKLPVLSYREKKQMRDLGIFVPTGALWGHVIVNDEKVFYCYSAEVGDPEMRIGRLDNLRDRDYGHSSDFLIIVQGGKNGSAKISKAIIRIKWEKKSDKFIDFLIKELNNNENGSGNRWLYNKNKRTVNNAGLSKIEAPDLLEIVKKCLTEL